MTSRNDRPTEAATTTQLTVAIGHSRERREEASVLRAETRQAVRHARALREETNAILASAVAITEEILSRCEIALAEPVAAKFHPTSAGAPASRSS
jgi:hypothetical protein